jgi:DNA-directed RNA polymerase specialized sigma subunit
VKNAKFDKFHEMIFCISKYNSDKFNSDSDEHKEILNLMKNFIIHELTNKQKMCLNLHFNDMLNTVQISRKLSICPSTVSRHLKKAKLRIRKLMGYYYSKFK